MFQSTAFPNSSGPLGNIFIDVLSGHESCIRTCVGAELARQSWSHIVDSRNHFVCCKANRYIKGRTECHSAIGLDRMVTIARFTDSKSAALFGCKLLAIQMIKAG
jgi:hypothetical protein